MFWTAIVSSFRPLGHWEIWIGAIACGLAILASQVVTSHLISRGGSADPGAEGGCLTLGVGASVQTVATSLYLAFVLPLVVGSTHAATLAELGAMAGLIVWAGVLGGLGSLVVSLVPVLGRSHTLQTFVSGVVVCRVLLESSGIRDIPYPDLLPSLGFVVLAAILGHLVLIGLAAAASVLFGDTLGSEPPPAVMPVIAGVLTVVGYLPVFMYVRYSVLGLVAQGRLG